MQNQFVGDIGDYGKYGLLRALAGIGPDAHAPLSLGIAWYLVPNEGGKAGKFTDYLKQPQKYRPCDPELFDALYDIVFERKHRAVSEVRTSDIFPDGTEFYEDKLDFRAINGNSPAGRERRRNHRKSWIKKAAEQVSHCPLVFLDPDNGIEVKSRERHTRAGTKYAYYDEIRKFVSQGQITVVYHHLGMNCSHEQQARDVKRALRSEVKPTGDVFPLMFRPYSPRAFFIITSQRDTKLVEDRVTNFMASEWERLRLSSRKEKAWLRIR